MEFKTEDGIGCATQSVGRGTSGGRAVGRRGGQRQGGPGSAGGIDCGGYLSRGGGRFARGDGVVRAGELVGGGGAGGWVVGWGKEARERSQKSEV